MSTHNICSWRNEKKYYSFYLELCITKKPYLGLTKTGLNSGAVLFSSGLNSGILLYLVTQKILHFSFDGITLHQYYK